MGRAHSRTARRGRIGGRALSALLAIVVSATSVRAGDPVLFAIVDGAPPELSSPVDDVHGLASRAQSVGGPSVDCHGNSALILTNAPSS